MPFYQYSALDRSGRKQEGTIQAGNASEALQQLLRSGWTSPKILREALQPQPPPNPQRPPSQDARQPQNAAPTQIQQNAAVARNPRPAPMQSQPLRINVPTAPAPPSPRRSKKASDRERFFLFAQISDQLRAGINPAQVFGELAQMYKQPKFRESLGMVSNAAIEGRPISDVLALWPDLYPEHVVGLVRAGEMGGFLPEATATISEQAMNAYKFKRFHWWIWVLVINLLLSVPMVFLARHSLFATYDAYMKPGADSSPALAWKVIWDLIKWPWGPLTIGVIILAFALREVFSLREVRKLRHEVGLRMPVLGSRARNESVTVFTWVLSKLARSGVPPNTSWDLARDSVPNLAMQKRLTAAGHMMNEGSRLSDVVFRSNLFPQEYAPAISTGELTGDISGALERLSQVSRNEFEVGTTRSKAFTGSLGCIGLLLTTGFVTCMLAYVWYNEFYGKVQKDFDPDAVTQEAPQNVQPSTKFTPTKPDPSPDNTDTGSNP